MSNGFCSHLQNFHPFLLKLQIQVRNELKFICICSFESNIMSANARKSLKYTQLKLDLEQAGYSCSLLPFELWSRGYVSKSNRANLINTFVVNNIKANALKCIKQLSKLSLLCSFSVFHAYTQPTWRDPPFLKA